MICPHCGSKAVRKCPKCKLPYCQNCGSTAVEIQPHHNCPTKDDPEK